MFPLLLIIRSKLNKRGPAVGDKTTNLRVMMMKTVKEAREVRVNQKRKTSIHENASTGNLVHAKTKLITNIQHGPEAEKLQLSRKKSRVARDNMLMEILELKRQNRKSKNRSPMIKLSLTKRKNYAT